MNHHLLIAEFLATPWALMPERLNAVAAVLTRWSQDVPAGEDVLASIAADRAVREARRQATTMASGGGIAVLPLYGVVTQRGNMVDDVSGPGSVSTQQFASALRQALADDSVSQILIDIDSPGGSVYGVSELADEIVSARAQKPVVAIANSLAASAAYWIGCSASEFYVTPGGEVGSIGVWQAHIDYSQALEFEGIKPTLISAGKYKVEGNPYVPLDEDAQAFMQSRVDDYYGSFIKAVSRGRGVPIAQVRDGMGQGRVLGADAAQTQNMVDGVATFDDVIRKMRRDAKATTRPKVSRLAQAQRELEILDAGALCGEWLDSWAALPVYPAVHVLNSHQCSWPTAEVRIDNYGIVKQSLNLEKNRTPPKRGYREAAAGYCLRRRDATRPRRPRPKSTRVAGSGTASGRSRVVTLSCVP